MNVISKVGTVSASESGQRPVPEIKRQVPVIK